MGLAERKLVSAIKEGDYKSFETKMKEVCGFDVKLTFDWSVLENHKDCTFICDRKKYNSYMFDRVLEAMTKICADSMGKEAVQTSLKEIVMIPSVGDLKFAAGVLTIHNDLNGNGAYDAGRIKATLEKGL